MRANDYSYYMTEDCLSQTADLVKEALYHLKKGDRLALYTTCCIQEAVARTIPKIWHPLEPVDTISIKLCTDMVRSLDLCAPIKRPARNIQAAPDYHPIVALTSVPLGALLSSPFQKVILTLKSTDS